MARLFQCQLSTGHGFQVEPQKIKIVMLVFLLRQLIVGAQLSSGTRFAPPTINWRRFPFETKKIQNCDIADFAASVDSWGTTIRWHAFPVATIRWREFHVEPEQNQICDVGDFAAPADSWGATISWHTFCTSNYQVAE